VQRWKGLANQARAEGQSLQVTRDEDAALYAEQVISIFHVTTVQWLTGDLTLTFSISHAHSIPRVISWSDVARRFRGM